MVTFIIINKLKVLNDMADKTVKLIRNFNDVITKNKDQKQCTFFK